MRKGRPEIFLWAVLTLSVGNVASAPYKFSNLYDSGGPFNSFGLPALNNSGTVAFSARLDNAGESGIFIGRGGPTTTIADSSGPLTGPFAPSLNNSGRVAFASGLDTGGQGIFTGNGGPITTIADNALFEGSPPFQGFFREPSINDSGTVAFYFERGDPFSPPDFNGIFTGTGGPITTIADTSTLGDFFTGFPPSINNSGTVAFAVFPVGGVGPPGPGIFAGSGGPITPIAADTAFDEFGSPSLNDSGTVAFTAANSTEDLQLTDSDPLDFPPGEECAGGDFMIGIFTSSGGPLTTILPCTPDGFSTALVPSLNNSGTVAFWTEDTGTGPAIFTGPDLVADKLIGAGDMLFGSTATSIHMGNESLNDAGQIAFFYTLADGRAGIARADPLIVPEPSTLPLLLVAGLLGAVMWRRN